MILSKINHHERDDKIKFVEEGHIYNIYIPGINNGNIVSVTKLAHKYFDDFDADKVIENMMKSKNWSKSKYYGMTKEEIKDTWEENRKESSMLGTNLHDKIEVFFNGELKDEDIEYTIEFSYFLNWWKDFKKINPQWVPYRTEWRVYDEDKCVAGSIDMVFSNDKDELWIVDWKRSKEIKKNNPYRKGKGILSHLDDCNYSQYCLQLNIYRHILETKYHKKIIRMDLVVMHPNNKNYITYNVPFFTTEIEQIWDEI
jgi:ATP-dependent exoDNAse (exonuclease V) beta subunit